ncbi:MAG: hypothetical protein MUE46_16280 [Xanthomonadales bacterium]|jgi:hypothetical protein|nr:hypothetical protein [Xanthomonadales bacterium]
MTVLGLLLLALALWVLIRGESWWAGRQVRRLREPRQYWMSLGGCVLVALLCFVLAPMF